MQLSDTKFIRIYSDIHLEFDIPKKEFKFEMLWMPEKLDTDKETTLILAGDIWHSKKAFSYYGKSWMKQISEQFQYVLIVLGNHDFWHGNLSKEYNRFNAKIKEQNLSNIYLLQNSQINIGNNKFIGATLWTDFLMGNSICMSKAKSVMNDYKFIKNGVDYNTLKPQHILSEHIQSKNYIFENAKKDFDEQKIWVITHHLPSFNSIDKRFQTKELAFENALYYTNLDYLIKDSEINYWIHGHSHHARNYWIDKTRILANPRGYPNEQSLYDPWHLIELES